MRILVTGGTVFVSRYAAEYFVRAGHDVAVLNRGSRSQAPGVRHICGDRRDAVRLLKGETFDAVLDVTAYTPGDVDALLDALPDVPRYVLISSSAVYPETAPQPFREETPVGENTHWGAYGLGKIGAERHLLARRPDAYILRPPYLYGPGNEVYREAFVFDCALADRPFLLPGDGSMPLQFFHVRDLCRLMERILLDMPREHIFNTGNPQSVTIREWVTACYAAAGKTPRFIRAEACHPQRSYFPFLDYAYALDVTRQTALLPKLTPMAAGLEEAFAWYRSHDGLIRRKPLLDYIDHHMSERKEL